MIVNISTLQLAVVFKKSFIHELHADNATFNFSFICSFLQKQVQKVRVSFRFDTRATN